MLEPLGYTSLFHADWSVSGSKRWLAAASWRDRWIIDSVRLVGPVEEFVYRLAEAAKLKAVLAGGDFPMGVPQSHGEQTGFPTFPKLLEGIGVGRWSRYAEIARLPEEISIERPFYPAGVASGVKQSDLFKAHGVKDLDSLRRMCERRTAERRAACPLFWTLGGNQVGRAALTGWIDFLKPAMQVGARLWPFDGTLRVLGAGPGLTIAETYPAEVYGHVGVRFSNRESKRKQSDRRGKAAALFDWAKLRNVVLAPDVKQSIADGFGSDRTGEDKFDALVGVIGMIQVVSGHRGEGQHPNASPWEGWILGQATPDE